MCFQRSLKLDFLKLVSIYKKSIWDRDEGCSNWFQQEDDSSQLAHKFTYLYIKSGRLMDIGATLIVFSRTTETFSIQT